MLDRYDYEIEDVMLPEEKDELVKLKEELKLLKQRQNDTLDFIEQTCQYDKRLLGYERGIERSETSTLVLKLTGKYPRELKRD
jgi:hypothetical protein